MFLDYSAELLMERDFSFSYWLLVISMFFMRSSFFCSREYPYQNDSYEIDSSQPKKVSLSPKDSYNQRLYHKKVDAEEEKKVFFHRFT